MRSKHIFAKDQATVLATVLATVMAPVLFLILLPHAHAHDFSVGPVMVSNPWSPPLPPISENGVAYLNLSNHEMKADRLVAASTPVADRVEFHTSVKSGSMMMMEKMQAVELPAHGNVALEPGGMHVMLIDMKNPLKKNTSFPLTLTFEHAGTVTVDVTVRLPAGAASAPAMNHNMSDGTMDHKKTDKHKH